MALGLNFVFVFELVCMLGFSGKTDTGNEYGLCVTVFASVFTFFDNNGFKFDFGFRFLNETEELVVFVKPCNDGGFK